MRLVGIESCGHKGTAMQPVCADNGCNVCRGEQSEVDPKTGIEEYVNNWGLVHTRCDECNKFTPMKCEDCSLCHDCCEHRPDEWLGSHLGHPKPRKDSPIRNRIADLYFMYPCIGDEGKPDYSYMMEAEGLTEEKIKRIRRIGKKIYILNGKEPRGIDKDHD
jgi:hypothetical protein